MFGALLIHFAKRLVVLAIAGGILFGMTKAATAYINKSNVNSDAGSVEVSTKQSGTYQQVVEVVEIPFKSLTKTTNALRAGTTTLAQKGEVGEKTVTYAITYEGGKEVSRKVQHEEVTKRPKDEVTIKGTLQTQ